MTVFVGECSECGRGIENGEFHQVDDPDAQDPERTCQDCSDLPDSEFPDQ